jgi:hypothetical protein
MNRRGRGVDYSYSASDLAQILSLNVHGFVMFVSGLPAKSFLRATAAAAALFALGACASGGSTSLDQAELDREAVFQRQLVLEENVASQRRIEEVSFRLMTAAADFCVDRKGAAYGFTVANRHSFGTGMADAATAAFGLDNSAKVLSVTSGSPAYEAGLIEGDVITRINGKPIKPGKNAANAVSKAVAEAGSGGLNLNIGGANPRRVRIEPVVACNYSIEVLNSDKVNAYADGDTLRVTKGMLWFATDEAELAMVLSHELAHNLMGHAGTFASMFYNKKSRESDADYVGLYIMARGDFEIEKAAKFWRRLAAAFPKMIESSSSHPLMPARFLAIRKTTEEIRAKEAKGLPLVPRRVDNLALIDRSAPKQPES